MAITMNELRKNIENLDKKVNELCKGVAFVDGSATSKIEQLKTSGGSGAVSDVPKNDMVSGAFVDGTQKGVERGLNSKGGSGAGVNGKFVGIKQTGRHFNEGSSDTEEMIKAKACAKKKDSKAGNKKMDKKKAKPVKKASVKVKAKKKPVSAVKKK
jgi:hypothetical protein